MILFGVAVNPCRITLRVGAPLDPATVKNHRDGWEKIVGDIREAIVALGSA